MHTIYVKTYFPKQRSVALTAVVGLVLVLVYLLSGSTQASAGATVSSSSGACSQTVGSSTGVSVTVVNNNCVITFANVGTTTWTVPAGVSAVRSLVVGGGGGSGSGGCNWMWPRGGGGGEVVDTSTAVTQGSTLGIIVGGGGVIGENRGCGGPAGQSSPGTSGGPSRFGTLTEVRGGHSSPVSTSAGGASGSGKSGSGGVNLALDMASYAGGGGGGAGGEGGQVSGGNNSWLNADKPGVGGIGVFSDITGSLIGHGGGGAGMANGVWGTATSGGGSGGTSGQVRSVNYGGSYGGGGDSGSGGSGVVIISFPSLSVPDAPTIGSATATGGTTATVAFTAPASNGGATINSYTATSSPAGGTGTLSQAGSGTISVTSLQPGVDYTFTVTATNSVGVSSPSAASNSITTTQPTATSGQLPSVLLVDPQSSSLYLPTTLNTAGATNLLLCLNESDSSGTNLMPPSIFFDIAANGTPIPNPGSGSSTISGDTTAAAYIYGISADVITTLNSVSGTRIYLASGNFNSSTGASKYIRVRAISIVASSDIGSKSCASTPYTSQIIEIRPLGLTRIMKKGTITLRP